MTEDRASNKAAPDNPDQLIGRRSVGALWDVQSASPSSSCDDGDSLSAVKLPSGGFSVA